jgi:rhamnogalacturonan acetylesterase
LPALAAILLAGCKSTSPSTPTSRSSTANPAPAPALGQTLPESSANFTVAQGARYRTRFLVDPNRTFPMLFIVGDSTVHNSGGGRLGWGDVIGNYFDTNQIRVENHALGGRSSRTFITQGWWNLVLQAAKPGDFVLIQLGHNDGGPLDDTNRARGSIRGIGYESREIYNPIIQKREVVHTYGWYLRKYIADARSEGMTPIICSPVPHVPKTEVKPGDIENWGYVRWAGEVATNQHALFINLNQIVISHYAGMTPTEIRAKYFTPLDHTHSSPAGAELNAQSVVEGLRKLNCPLKNYLLETPVAASGAN